MSLSNATENDILELILKGVDPSWRAGGSQWLALVTDADGAVSEAAPIANEVSYDGYARVEITKATGWNDNGSNFTNKGQIQFGKRTNAGTATVTAFVVVDTASGAIDMGVIGKLSAELDIGQNIQPQFAIGDLTITAE